MRFRSFQGRILTFFLGLFILVQAAAFYAINVAQARNARAQIDSELEVGAGVFSRLLEVRSQRLVEAARLLSGDFAFKSAYATGDGGTILSALGNHRDRIGADVMVLATLDRRTIADTLHPAERGAPLSFSGIIEAASARGESEISSIVFIDERPYQMVVVPLLAPVPDAWICIGFLIDDPLAAELRRLTLSHVSLLRRSAVPTARDPAAGPGPAAPPGSDPPFSSRGGLPGTTWSVVASTLPQGTAARMAAALATAPWTENRSFTTGIDGEEYVTLVTRLGGAAGPEVVAVLQRSLAEALAPHARLRLVLIALFSGGVVLTVVVGALIARTVTRPVLLLAESARKVKAGDYMQRLDVRQRDEVGELTSSFNELVGALEEKDRVRSLLGKVVSPAVAHELLSRGIELGGEERQVTILFSDIREFTNLSESRSPHEVVSFLNEYLTRMSGVVEAHGGIVDKYIGDAMMALFGAPLAQSDDPSRAVRAALEMIPALDALNQSFRERGAQPIGMGIGINTAEVVAGNMGSTTRLNYTVIGDGVNLASRLEGLTKIYGVPILVSETTVAAAPGFVYREIDRARVKGKTKPVTLYQPLGEEGEVDAETLVLRHAFHEALRDYRRRDWAAAREKLQGLLAAAPGAKLYRVYLQRVDDLDASPPPPDWDGAHSHLEK